jgi:hypothetical protein
MIHSEDLSANRHVISAEFERLQHRLRNYFTPLRGGHCCLNVSDFTITKIHLIFIPS